jgi:hypothetical protein
MNLAKAISGLLLLLAAFILPASALTLTAPENRVWEIFSTGYDAAETPAAIGTTAPVKSTCTYDQAPIHSTGAETVARGDKFVLATPQSEVRAGSYFEKEVQYLQSKGYVYNSNGSALVPPK